MIVTYNVWLFIVGYRKVGGHLLGGRPSDRLAVGAQGRSSLPFLAC